MNADYQATLATIRGFVAIPQSPSETIRQVMQLLRDRHPQYEWIGVYVLQGENLELGPYVGAATAHERIPVGTGVCGTAVLRRRNMVFEDVRELSNYLACSATVRSEIVVLIWQGDKILGQIDADCDAVGAFTAADEQCLTQVADLIAPAVAKLVRQPGGFEEQA